MPNRPVAENARRHRRTPGRRAIFSLALLSVLLAGCGPLSPLPEPRSLTQRLETLPTQRLPIDDPVEIRWNSHHVPFIIANNDDDAAFALGLVHAHLRLGQLAIYKRIASGRIAEMGGPLATDIDKGIRTLNFARAVDQIEADLPLKTRRWLQRFADGLNHYQSTARELPYEFQALGLEPEPWRIGDLLVLGRLGGTDVNWLVWYTLLGLRDRQDWPRIWDRLVSLRTSNMPSFEPGDTETAVLQLIAGASKTGSNTIVISPKRTRSGAALIANDPHLGLTVPNTWLIVGLKSPSMHAVGLMPVGLPVFAIGRNPWIAWGGTNMRAAASDLIDVSTVPASEITTRAERIAVRWWPDETATVRETVWGPIISDAPILQEFQLPDLALRWTGHDVSDEISAMLKVARAETFADFKRAFETFSLPGQNMLYADGDGNIGQLMAVRIPNRDGWTPDGIIRDIEKAEEIWDELRDVSALPWVYNPDKGYLASANNRPVAGDTTVGYFFSPDDRMRRMAAIMAAENPVDIDTLKSLQADVYVHSSVVLRDAIVAKMGELGMQPATEAEASALRILKAWDGFYDPTAAAPVVFEAFRHRLATAFYRARFGEEDGAAFSRFGGLKTLLAGDLAASNDPDLGEMLRGSLAAAASAATEFDTWGDMHRLQIRHPLAFLPVIGDRFVFADHPIGGSTESLMKTAHGSTTERHRTRYGANARHISDMADIDKNFFVLLGGQDGWLNSSTFLDQKDLWLAGEYIEVPLRLDSVEARFPIITTLLPDEAP